MEPPARSPLLSPFLAALVASVLAVVPNSPGAAQQAPAPRVRAENPTHDAGPVPGGEPVEHRFVLHNEGDAPLELVEVNPTCGCTVAEYDRVIPPGGSGSVRAQLQTTDLRGPVAKSIRVLTNDPETRELVLVLKANVRLPVVADPGYARYVTVHGEPAPLSEQILWSPDFAELEVKGVTSPYPFLAVRFREAGEKERRSEGVGRQWRIEMALDREAPIGPLADHVEVRLNHPRQPSIRIPVAGFVRPLLAVSPPAADFGPRELTTNFSARLEIRNLSRERIDLTTVETDLEGVTATLTPVEEGRRYELQVTLHAEMPKGAFAGKVRIRTTSPRQPLVEVEVKGKAL